MRYVNRIVKISCDDKQIYLGETNQSDAVKISQLKRAFAGQSIDWDKCKIEVLNEYPKPKKVKKNAK